LENRFARGGKKNLSPGDPNRDPAGVDPGFLSQMNGGEKTLTSLAPIGPTSSRAIGREKGGRKRRGGDSFQR